MCYYAAKFRSPQSMAEHGLCERNATSHFVSFHIIKALDGGRGSTANGRGEFYGVFSVAHYANNKICRVRCSCVMREYLSPLRPLQGMIDTPLKIYQRGLMHELSNIII
jgi:hypothetical protein